MIAFFQRDWRWVHHILDQGPEDYRESYGGKILEWVSIFFIWKCLKMYVISALKWLQPLCRRMLLNMYLVSFVLIFKVNANFVCLKMSYLSFFFNPFGLLILLYDFNNSSKHCDSFLLGLSLINTFIKVFLALWGGQPARFQDMDSIVFKMNT